MSSGDFSPYESGEKVFNVTSKQEITLRTNSLTQMESQLLVGLVESPLIYMLQTYDYGGTNPYPYGVPYIIVTDSIKYEQKKNDKIIFMEVTIRPANEGIIQSI
jgi:hypothetical protein